MRYIAQEHYNDCGVACVAMLSGQTYSKAKKAIFGDKSAGYTDKNDLTKALSTLGCKPSGRMVPFNGKDFRKLGNVMALIKANLQQNGVWHWVVWDGDGNRILDPRRKGYNGNRLKVVSYLLVR